MELVGVDVGGTFTDLVAVDERSGAVRVFKVPSTPANQADGVLAGLRALCGGCGGIRRLVHGSTVATNTVLEGKGARVALVTTRGFRDVLEIGRCRRMAPGMFNTKYVRPRPLVPRRLRFEVTERLRHTGEVAQPLAEAEVEQIAEALAAEEVEAVAVCFLHAYANPGHEERAKAILAQRLPAALTCTSAEILPEYREFERFSTAAMNAYVAPVMRRYIAALARDLAAEGYRGELYSMASSGGVMSTATTVRYPVRTILSGPAGGVSGAIFAARSVGVTNLITYDMGGTSTDVCLLERLVPPVSTEGTIAGFPVKAPQIEIHTVGAGGGSIAWIDIEGALRVGPQSAGALPGPACYGKGGTAPTITDANLFLGRLSSTSLLGGQLSLHPSLAERALAELGQRLGRRDLDWLAEGIIQLAVTRMAGAIRKISIERGYHPRDFTLVAMGGAGPMHAAQVAEELGIQEILVPPWPGNVSALGLLTADLRHDFVRSSLARLADADLLWMEKAFAEMVTEGLTALQREGVPAEGITAARFADLRFVGQAYELMVPVPERFSREALASAFRAQYARRYGHDPGEDGEDVEVVNLRVACTGLTQPPRLPERGEAGVPAEAPQQRRAYFRGRWQLTPVLAREGLPPGAGVAGPAIVEEFGATSVVPPGWVGQPARSGALFLRPAEATGGRPGPR
jgi:N-methylhydantoinase A